MLSVLAAPPGDSAYTFIWVLVGLVSVGGAGGLLGIYKWAKKQGVRDAQLDRVIGVVLGDGNGGKPLKDRLDAQDRKLDQIQHEATPNGGNTQRLGDVAKRSERKIDDLSSSFAEFKGQIQEAVGELKARLTAQERRTP